MFRKMHTGEKIVFIGSFILFMSIGLIFFVPGVIKSMKCDANTNAVVVNVDSYVHTDIDTHAETTVYQPTISYEVNGVNYNSPYGDHTNIGVLHQGETVSIRYDSEHPSVFVLDRWYGLEPRNFLGLFIIVFFIMFTFQIRKQMNER